MDQIDSQYILSGTYTPTLQANATILNLNLQSHFKPQGKDKYVLVVLDTSGSMAGSKIQTSKSSIYELLETLYTNSPHPKVDLITFNDTPTLYSLQDKTYDDCIKLISGVDASGGTSFIPVFNLIQNLLQNEKSNKDTQHSGPKKVKYDDNSKSTTCRAPVEEVAVVLLSDGQAEGLDTLRPYVSKMKKFAEENLVSAEFHTLGFGEDHDARLLEELTKSMPTQGSFQYIRETPEIGTCIQNISQYLVEKRLAAFVSWVDGKGRHEKKVNFIPKDDKMQEEGQTNLRWEGIVCVDKTVSEFEAIKSTLKLHIKVEKDYEIIDVDVKYKQAEGKCLEMNQNFVYINEELKKISDSVISGGKFDAQKAEEYRSCIANLRVMLNELMRNVFKLKIDERKIAIDRARDLNDYMNSVGELLRTSASQSLTNHQIASVNALAYRHVTRNSNLKTLDKRALQNVELLNQVSSKVKSASKRIDEKDFAEKYKTLIEEVGCCALNLSNIPEALKSQDCLCLTFDIARPEVAIQDASRIVIRKIYPTVICATAFLDSVKFSMKLNPNNSGGFDPAFHGDIVKGASNESITGALPLYYCKEHWEVASEYIKPIVGWDVTLDPLGYDYNQLRTVPFLLLIKALEDREENNNEFNSKVVRWIMETCCQIIKDEMAMNAKANLAETVKGLWERYHEDGTVRGVETVQNNKVLLAYVYCLQEMGVMKLDSEEVVMRKVGYMVEEEMRRTQEKSKIWNTNQIRKKLQEVFDVDLRLYSKLLRGGMEEEKVAEELTEVKEGDLGEIVEDKEKKFVEVFHKLRKIQPKKNVLTIRLEREKRNQKKAQERKMRKEKSKEFNLNVCVDWLTKLSLAGFKLEEKVPLEFDGLEGVQKEYAKIAFRNFEKSSKFINLWLKLWGYQPKNFKKIESIGIQTPIQLLTLYIQNNIQHKNSDRQESFQTGQYADPFEVKACCKYLESLVAQIIYDNMLKEDNDKPKEMDCSYDDIDFFAKTENLEAAAGVLASGFNLGSFEALQQILRRKPETCCKVLEKLMMIRDQDYEGVYFEFDYQMKKKFARQLYKKYRDRYGYEDWKEVWYKEKDYDYDCDSKLKDYFSRHNKPYH